MRDQRARSLSCDSDNVCDGKSIAESMEVENKRRSVACSSPEEAAHPCPLVVLSICFPSSLILFVSHPRQSRVAEGCAEPVSQPFVPTGPKSCLLSRLASDDIVLAVQTPPTPHPGQ